MPQYLSVLTRHENPEDILVPAEGLTVAPDRGGCALRASNGQAVITRHSISEIFKAISFTHAHPNRSIILVDDLTDDSHEWQVMP